MLIAIVIGKIHQKELDRVILLSCLFPELILVKGGIIKSLPPSESVRLERVTADVLESDNAFIIPHHTARHDIGFHHQWRIFDVVPRHLLTSINWNAGGVKRKWCKYASRTIVATHLEGSQNP
jgi:hypothetical protein